MYFRFTITFSFIILYSLSIYSQGSLKGKVSDENGEPIIGAILYSNSNPNLGTTTDFDGNYTLVFKDTGKQIVTVTYLGYNTQEVEVEIVLKELVIRDIIMLPTATELVEVEIVAKQERASAYYMENIKKRAATTIDYVSAQSMKLSGDNNATSAIARVSGVSTNGSFITVRGIGDRYIKTTLNGAQIPTLDPFTNNIKLDIFPASLIDNIIISKTASPDLPGSFSGAFISVETKDYPEKLAINIETQVGYNNQSSLKEVLYNGSSKTDWLGYDNSFRDHDHNTFQVANPSPTRYQELIAVGLGDFYKALGITESWAEGTTAAENYYKLGLVELGLLPKAQFEDPRAFEEAKRLFIEKGYRDQAYVNLNSEAAKSGKSFANNWNLYKKVAPLNFSQTFSIGNQIKLFNRDFGFMLGLRYGSTVLSDPTASLNRTLSPQVDSFGNPMIDASVDLQTARYTNGWSALFSGSYKFNPNHSVSLLFMPNFIGVNNLRDGLGEGDIIYKYEITKSQFYEQRKQLIYQIKSEHFFPNSKIKLDFNASYSFGDSKAPDFKNLELFAGSEFVYSYDKTRSFINRDYRYLSEDIFDSNINFTLPINEKAGFTRKLKFGAAYQSFNRLYDQYNYSLNFNNVSPIITNNDLDSYFSLDRFGIGDSNFGGELRKSIDFFYGRPDPPSNHTLGFSNISAGYVMVDYTLLSALRISGGLRLELSDLLTDAKEYYEKKLPFNDKKRVGPGDNFIINEGVLKSTDFLPSVNLIYKLKKDEIFPINLRLNYSKTLARPSLREYSETIVYDFELNSPVLGNSQLQIVKVDNYDLRLESYFHSGNSLSVSLFYKKFKNHIELSEGITWTNSLSSHVAGVEFEGKVKILKGLDFRLNLAFINSSAEVVFNRLSILNFVRTWTPIDTVTRAMYGQSPYVVNGILSYNLEKLGMSITASYNLQGPRLVLSSLGGPPDIYEMPRHLLDFKISQNLGSHFGISISIRDVLNSAIRRSYKFEEGFILDFDKYNFGTSYNLGVSYKF